MFSLAHISDLHLGPLPKAEAWNDYLGKRAIGYLSWTLRRRKIHDPLVIAALAEDIAAHSVDHVALTGDLINIALPAEYRNAATWLKKFGSADWITLVPGNHDAYVGVGWEKGLGLWAEYMTGEMRMPGTRPSHHNAALFPFVRHRRNVALIGTSTAIPQTMRRAGGSLGPDQLKALAHILTELRQKGFFRILLIHHPPLPGQADDRKALSDSAHLKEILEAEGVELVLHGHNHTHMRMDFKTKHGPAHVIGVSSASALAHRRKPPAAWHLYRITRQDGVWLTETTVRTWNRNLHAFETEAEFILTN
jgi:3',5'-cyclic AMP phosphodiesterase CpdA